MAKKITTHLFTAIWVLLLCSLGVYYIFFAPREAAYSPEENRNLAGFPEVNAKNIFSGDFGEQFETYLLDHFPLRNQVISGTNKIESSMSLASHEDYLLIADTAEDPLDTEADSSDVDSLLQDLGPKPTEPPVETTPVVTEPQQTEPTETTEPGEDPPIVQKPAATLEDYPNYMGVYMNTGGNDRTIISHSRDRVAAVTALLNRYARLLPENGKVMFTVVPQSIYGNQFVNAENKVSFYANWDDLVNGLGDNNVYAFDAAEIMTPSIQAGNYVYFRTDMHWNPYGTYLVYSQMAQQAGKEPASYRNDFTITVEDPFRGTYYRDNPGAYGHLTPDRLDLLMPKCGLEWRRTTAPDEYKVIDFLDFNARANDRYTVYLGGPAGPWTYAQCDNGQTENCLIVTDSFGLSFVPFLTANYQQVHYYDPRYYNQNTVGYTVAEMIEKYEIQDIYVVVGDLHSFDSGFLLTTANQQLGIQ